MDRRKLIVDKEQLPEDWDIKSLGDLYENLDNKRSPITKSSRNAGDIPYYGASGIVDYVADFIFNEDLLLVSEDGANLLARTYPIAFSITGKTWVNNHAHILRFKQKITQIFIEYYLNSIPLDLYVSGMAQPKLNQKALNSIPIPVPPLDEQKRIVAILDEAFEGIDQAIRNTEKNLVNARELFESYLNKIFTQKDNGWEEKTIGECFKVKSGDFLPKKNANSSGDFDVYGGNGFTGKHDKFNLSGCNIVIGRVGAKCGNVRSINKEIWLTDNAFYISTFLRKFDYDFLAIILTMSNLGQTANQTAQPVISYKTIQPVLLSYPIDLETQKVIIKKVNELKAEIQQLETIYRKKLAALNELKQSILQKAFTGQLT